MKAHYQGWPEILPPDISSLDTSQLGILPPDISPLGHFAARRFCRVNASPSDLSYLGLFGARSFCRQDISLPGKFNFWIINHTWRAFVLTNFAMREFEKLQSKNIFPYSCKLSPVNYWYVSHTMHMKSGRLKKTQKSAVIIYEGQRRNMLR